MSNGWEICPFHPAITRLPPENGAFLELPVYPVKRHCALWEKGEQRRIQAAGRDCFYTQVYLRRCKFALSNSSPCDLYKRVESFAAGPGSATFLRGDFTRMSKPVSSLLYNIPYCIVKAVNELDVGMLVGPLRLGACKDSVIVAAILARSGSGDQSHSLIVIDDFKVNRVAVGQR